MNAFGSSSGSSSNSDELYPQYKNVFEIEEILSNVLANLPVKCLLLCKCVCKYWRSLICSPSFMVFHFIKSQETQSYIVCHYRWGKILCEKDGRRTICLYYHHQRIHLLTQIEIDGETETTHIPPNSIGFYFKGMICSFNGLICCVNRNPTFDRRCYCDHENVYGLYRKNFSINICNPATQQVFSLPQAPASQCPNHNYQSFLGVSFRPNINEYKVFQFFSKEKRPFECMVYSSITGSWKSIATVIVSDCPRPPPNHSSSNNHVCIDGTVHWLWKSRLNGQLVSYILAVDWEENFSIIRIPEEEKTIMGVLGNLEGRLCIVVVTTNDGPLQHRFDVWVLEDSEHSVWVKKLTDFLSFSTTDPIRSVVVRTNEILFATRKQYSLYKIPTKSWRVSNWACGPHWFFSPPLACTESLFPCNERRINS